MARVKGPLLSQSAKGRIGNLIVYYGNGKARGWSTQTDPQTAPQLQSRAIVREVMQMVKLCDALDRAVLREVLGKQWHTVLTAWLTRQSLSNAKTLHAEWVAFTDEQRQAWESVVPT